MATQGPLSTSTAVNDSTVGNAIWNNTDNVKVSDGIYATFSGAFVISEYLKTTNFGFTIPTGATINGILVEIKRKTLNYSNNIQDSSVNIVKSNGTFGITNMSTVYWLTTESYVSFGSPTNLWGETWTSEDINNSNFGIGISIHQNTPDDTANIDHIRITVYYTLPASSTITGISSITGLQSITL